VKIDIHQITVDPARVNSAFPTGTNCRAGTAINFSVVNLVEKLTAVPAQLDLNSRSALLTLAVTLLNLAVALLTLAVTLLTLAVTLLTLAAAPAVNFSSGCYFSHGRATEEGHRTGFPLLRYGCQLRASALEYSSKWRNLKCLLYRY
jgi:hypothetical protein